MIIYKCTNKKNNKSYIGRTIQELEIRKQQHLTQLKNKNIASYFYNSLRKYGKDNFDWAVLWVGECNIEWLNELEKHYIYFYDTFKNGYNMTEGGDGAAPGKDNAFCKLDSEKRMKVILKGNIKRRKYRASKETKKKMSETRKRMYKGRNNPLSKVYKLISPNNKIFIVKDGLESFCNRMNLSFSMIRSSIKNNEILKETIYRNKTEKSKNTIGWRALECP